LATWQTLRLDIAIKQYQAPQAQSYLSSSIQGPVNNDDYLPFGFGPDSLTVKPQKETTHHRASQLRRRSPTFRYQPIALLQFRNFHGVRFASGVHQLFHCGCGDGRSLKRDPLPFSHVLIS
jgi:hypothetical protein